MRTQPILVVVLGLTAVVGSGFKQLDTFADGAVADRGSSNLRSSEARQDARLADLDPSKPLKTQWIQVFGDSTTATLIPDALEVDAEGSIYLEGWLVGRLQVGIGRHRS